MNEQPTTLEMIRIFLKNGIIIDMPIALGSLPFWVRACRSDGMVITSDVAFPTDMVVLCVRHEAQAAIKLPDPAVMGNVDMGRPN